MARASTIRLLEVDPDLGSGIHPSEREEATEFVVAWRTTLWPGRWDPATTRTGPSPAFAVLVLEGLLSRERLLAGGSDAEILGPGDVFDPWATDDGLVPTQVRWTVIAPTEVAVLDRRFLVAVRRWPTLALRLFERAAEQHSRLSVRAAINAVPHADQRILGTLWHLAGLYGTVRAGDEVVLPIRLTHAAIGRLARARRPTVTRAMKSLTGQRLLEPQPDGSLVLRQGSRAMLEPPVADLERSSVDGIHLVEPITRSADGRAPASRTLDRLATEVTLLRAAEADYRALFELAGIGVALIESSSGTLLRINERLAALLGSSIETLIGSTFWDHLHPDDRGPVRAQTASLLARRGRHAYLQARLISTSGALAWTRTSIAALHSGDTGADRLIAVVEDISEQRIATEARDAAEQELTAELDAMRELHRRSARVAEASTVAEMLELVLEGVLALQQGSVGSIQLYDPDTGSLVLAAHRGFSETLAARLRVVDPRAVDPDGATSCGRVLASSRPALVEDVHADPGYAPYRDWAMDVGYRGVYSAPMIGRTGALLGVLSVYFAAPRRPSERELRVTDLYLRLVVALVERAQAEEAAAGRPVG